MQGNRAERVGALIQEEMSRLILRSLEDPRLGLVTITHVRVSKDLRHARVYISAVEGGERRLRQALSALTRAAGFLRGELTRRLRLRYAPALLFVPDGSLEQSLHLADLFRQIEAGGHHEA
jgi:ribosome-binding factor A